MPFHPRPQPFPTDGESTKPRCRWKPLQPQRFCTPHKDTAGFCPNDSCAGHGPSRAPA